MPKVKLTQSDNETVQNIYDEGWYLLECTELQEKKDSEGANLWVYILKIIDADREESKKFINKKVFINVSEKGLGFAIPYWRAMGADVPDKIPESGLELELGFAKGRKCKAHNSPGIVKNKKTGSMKLQNVFDMFAPAV